ncbi:hypothetical protein [Desulforhopalus sp. IMCC35007]|uniref:hypothetical protein n=1 Tax=Desulforhopalus sp. IMCC35007 TaxID=2569543 RepID=UPI0010ADDACF|nr:hypothetical protein [Desulforhopalus sp. IMCC35007]TKB08196.1 hypothetical protein FCL48_14565 [Desulforhopalus sp. IMCC35007]
MDTQPGKCPICDKEIENNVLYRCCRCFKKYCTSCEGSESGKICPHCGMSARLVLDQGYSGKTAA